MSRVRDVRTIYFDSSFYVWLAGCSDGEAAAVAMCLNGLRVRPVFSDVHFRELLSVPRAEKNRRLHDRLSRLVERPLGIGADWTVLLADDEALNMIAVTLRATNQQEALAHAHALSADRRDPVHQTRWNEAHPDMATTMASPRHLLAWLIEFAGQLATQEFGCEDIDARRWPTQRGRTRTELLSICAILECAIESPEAEQRSAVCNGAGMMFDLLGTERVRELSLGRLVHASATAGDGRVARVSIGTAPDREVEGLAHTLRDATHMNRFAEHADVLSLLQVDTPQLRQIRRSKPVHALRARGLADRCFASRDLGDLMAQLPALLAELPHGL